MQHRIDTNGCPSVGLHRTLPFKVQASIACRTTPCPARLARATGHTHVIFALQIFSYWQSAFVKRAATSPSGVGIMQRAVRGVAGRGGRGAAARTAATRFEVEPHYPRVSDRRARTAPPPVSGPRTAHCAEPRVRRFEIPARTEPADWPEYRRKQDDQPTRGCSAS